RAAANEPGFQIPFRSIGELAGLPHVIAMPADEVWPGVAVRLRMDDQHCFPNFCSKSVLAGHRAAAPSDVPWNHRTAGTAVIDKDAGGRRFEGQHHLLAGIDQRQRATAKPPSCGVEIDVVWQRVRLGIDERKLDLITLMHDHQWAGDRAMTIAFS